MNYVLWIFFPALVAALWAYMFALGGPAARAVLTLGALPLVAEAPRRAAPQPIRARRGTPNERDRRAVGVAHFESLPHAMPRVWHDAPSAMTPDPAFEPGGVLLVQHAAPLIGEVQLPDPAPAYARTWDNFPDRLLATLSERTGAIQLDGWGTGEWRPRAAA